jgi:Acetyltransferase (GNAT) domain
MTIKEEQSRDIVEPHSTLKVVEVNSRSDPRWEAFVKNRPNSLIYHHPAWLQVLEESFNHQPLDLACEDSDGEFRGVFPLFYMQGLFTGRRLSSLPRTPAAGPLACDEQAMALLVREAVERTRAQKGTQFQVKMLSNALDGVVDGVIGVPWRETYVLELPERPELIRIGNSRNHARIKWSVNKATRLGVEVCQAETDQELRAWYKLYLETMRWISVPPRPYHFFEVAWNLLRPRGLLRLLLAYHSEGGRSRLLAGSLLLMSGQTVFYAFTGWRREDLSLRPNDVIQWRAIHDACADGYRYYDFGEVTKDNQGLADFKSKWGAEPQWMYRYYYPAPRELEANILDSSGRTRQLASAVWRRLPIRATVLLSDLAHHYL